MPRGGDAAAHLYRTFLVQHGALLWDNLWFAGQYPLASYSLLYYLPAALVGNEVLASIGVVAAAACFASLVVRVWGRAGRWPAYSFAVLAGGQFLTGDYPYTLGFGALLATLWALQRGWTVAAVAFAALTLGCSPLAFLFLCLALLALFFWFRQPRRMAVSVAAAIVVLAAIQFGALALFPSHGLYYPFGAWRFVLGLLVGLVGFAIATRSPAGRRLASIFAVWTATTIVGFVVASPIGHNLLRPATFVFPVMLLAALLADFRPRWLTVGGVVVAFAVNVGPYVTTVVERADAASQPAFWTPMLHYVAQHPSHAFRLEVVQTANHWEALYVPRAGYPIARGWYQQLDRGDNASLFRLPLTASRYRAWLRSVGVRYVLDPVTKPAPAAVAEASLLASGRSGLLRVFAGRDGSIYELPHATPILTGPGPSGVTYQSYNRIDGRITRAGTYLLRVHYTPYWRLLGAPLCIRPGAAGMTELVSQHGGYFSLRAAEGLSTFLQIVLDHDGHGAVCAKPSTARGTFARAF